MPGTGPCPLDAPGSETSPRSLHERSAANLGRSQCAAHWGWPDSRPGPEDTATPGAEVPRSTPGVAHRRPSP
eukprot:200885-Pyramimonas_sp.AAC.1